MTPENAPRFPLLILCALLFLAPLAHAADISDPFGLPKSALLAGGALLLLADAGVRALRGGTARRAPRVAVAASLLVLLAALGATLLSANRGLALRGLADLAALMVIAWAASRAAGDARRTPALFGAALAAAALVAAGTVAQILWPGFQIAVAGVSILPPSPAGATLGDPGLVAQWLLVSLPFGVAAVVGARGWWRIVAGVALGLVAGAMIFIGQTEGWIAAAIVAALMLATRVVQALRGGDGWRDLTPRIDGSGLRTAAVVVLVALLVVALARIPGLAASATPLPHVSLLAPTTGDPAADRTAAVQGTRALMALHPLGVGPAFWRHAFLEVAWTKVAASPFSMGHQAVHAGNSFLEMAAEIGAAGGLLFAMLLLGAILTAARVAFAPVARPDAASGSDPAKAALDTLMAAVVAGLLGSVFQEIAPAAVVFVALGLAFPAVRIAPLAPAGTSGPRRRLLPAIGLAIVVLLAGVLAPAFARRATAARATFAGQALLSAGDPAAAMRALDRPGVAASPEHLPHAILGNAALRAGQHEKAAAAFSAVIARSPWFLAAYAGRSAAYEEMGRYDLAEADLRKALALWPDSAATTLALGRLSARRGRIEPALAELKRAADLDPSQAEPWIAMGEILMRLGREEEAVSAFRTASQKSPRHPRVNILIGDALEKKGLLEVAVGYFQKATAIDPTSVEARLRLANVLHALHRACEARDAIQAARDLETNAARRDSYNGVLDRLDPECRAEQARPPR